MSISQSSVKILWAKSGSCCAMCNKPVVERQTDTLIPVGEMAHIKGHKPGSARYDDGQSDIERHSYNNLILLCPACHAIIDKNVAKYSVDYLHEIKSLHEERIERAIKRSLPTITFRELEETLRHIIDNPPLKYDSEDFRLIPIKDKVHKNNLSLQTEQMLKMGMASVSLIDNFLNKNASEDYPEKLRIFFVQKYKNLRRDTDNGDAIFYSLVQAASSDSSDPRHIAAAYGIVAYYFQLCEVFEK